MVHTLFFLAILSVAPAAWAENQSAIASSDDEISERTADDKTRESTVTVSGGFREARVSETISLDTAAEQLQCSSVEVTVSPVDGRDGHYRASMTAKEIGSGKLITAPSVELVAGDEPAVVMVGQHAGPRVRLEVSLDQMARAASVEVACFDGESIAMKYRTRIVLSR